MTSRVDLTRLISTIISENKRKTKAQQQVIFQRMLVKPGYEEYLNMALSVIFGLEYKRAHAGVFPTSSIELEARAEKRCRERKTEDEEVTVAKGLLVGRLLDLVAPNGKTLGRLTGEECLKCGGFFMKIGQEIGFKDVVGDVLTEADVRKMAEEAYGVSRSRPRSEDSQHRRSV